MTAERAMQAIDAGHARAVRMGDAQAAGALEGAVRMAEVEHGPVGGFGGIDQRSPVVAKLLGLHVGCECAKEGEGFDEVPRCLKRIALTVKTDAHPPEANDRHAEGIGVGAQRQVFCKQGRNNRIGCGHPIGALVDLLNQDIITV